MKLIENKQNKRTRRNKMEIHDSRGKNNKRKNEERFKRI